MKTIRTKQKNRLSKQIIAVLILYVKTQFVVMMTVSLITWTLLTLLHVQYALLLAFITGAFSVIPFFGMTIAAVLTSLVAIFDTARFLPQMHQIFEGISILIIYFILNQLVDLLLAPFLIGKITKVHPLLLLMSVIVGTTLFGIIGTLVAIPVVLVCKTMWEYQR